MAGQRVDSVRDSLAGNEVAGLQTHPTLEVQTHPTLEIVSFPFRLFEASIRRGEVSVLLMTLVAMLISVETNST